METLLPPIPAKRYFTIGEVGELCGVKPHVLRYWEQEFTQLRPVKRRGNRRYYQHHEVLMIRRIRDLLYDQGFTISGARNKMQEVLQAERGLRRVSGSDRSFGPGDDETIPFVVAQEKSSHNEAYEVRSPTGAWVQALASEPAQALHLIRSELHAIRDLLNASAENASGQGIIKRFGV